MPHGEDRPSGEDHVAELEAPLHRPAIDLDDIEEDVAGSGEDGEMVRKAVRHHRDEIGMPVPRKAARDLLQSDDVGTGKTGGDPFRVETPVHPHAVLYVIADQLHDML